MKTSWLDNLTTAQKRIEYEKWQRARLEKGGALATFTLEEWEEMERELEMMLA